LALLLQVFSEIYGANYIWIKSNGVCDDLNYLYTMCEDQLAYHFRLTSRYILFNRQLSRIIIFILSTMKQLK